MQKRSMIRHRLLLTGLALTVAAAPLAQAIASGSAAAQTSASSDNQTVPDKAADTWITTKVKAEFATTKGIKATDISVSTSDGVVTLTGSVARSNEKIDAVRVAKHVKGVKHVDASGITVKVPVSGP
jgi:hyperosmotically inducible protein